MPSVAAREEMKRATADTWSTGWLKKKTRREPLSVLFPHCKMRIPEKKVSKASWRATFLKSRRSREKAVLVSERRIKWRHIIYMHAS